MSVPGVTQFLNEYSCPDCKVKWTDRWSCAVDTECPSCGSDFSPTSSVVDGFAFPFLCSDIEGQDTSEWTLWTVYRDVIGCYLLATRKPLPSNNRGEIFLYEELVEECGVKLPLPKALPGNCYMLDDKCLDVYQGALGKLLAHTVPQTLVEQLG